MPESPERPNEDTLRRFLLGSLPPGEAARVEGWLAADPAAASALDRVVAVDPLAAAVAVAGSVGDPDADTTRTGDHSGAAGHPTAAVAVDPTPPDARPGPHGEWGGYRVVGELGRGGMGVVYEAVDERLGRRVALKVMAAGLAADPTSRERFLREARAVAAVDHDNIVPVFQVGEHAGVPYIAMPRLAGSTLADRLAGGPVPVGEAIEIARQVAAGLAAAHAAGLVHRDVKPSNLWLEHRPDGTFRRVRLLDFGLARAVTADAQVTRPNQILGTPAFMAPEQGWGRPVDHRADLFSLGVVLYRMAVGVMPFQAPDALALLSVVALKDPVRPRDANPAVPAALSDLIMRLLAKDPAQRPATASAVVAELDRIAARLSDPAPARERPRRRAVVALGVLAAGVLVALGGYVVIKVRNQDGVETTLKVPDGSNVTVGPDGTVTVVPPKGTDPPAIPPAGEMTERASAEWVLKSGGKIAYATLGEKRRTGAATRVGELPSDAFVVIAVAFDNKSALTDAGVRNLSGFTAVETLEVGDQPLTDAGWAELVELPGFRGVRELTLAATKQTSAVYQTLPRLPALGHARLWIDATSPDDLAALTRCPKLTKLILLVRDMPVAGFASLRGLRLGFLAVSGNGGRLPNELLDGIASIAGLGALQLWEWDLTGADLGRLSGSQHLTEFWTAKSHLPPDAFASMAKWPGLREVRVPRTKATDAHLAGLAAAPTLAALFCDQNPEITDAGLNALRVAKSLTFLDCNGCPKLTAAGIQKLSATLPGCLIKSDHGAFKGGSRQSDPAAPDKMAGRRKAAEWVCASGGNVVIRLDDGTERVIDRVADLPQKFELERFGIRTKGVTDEALIGHLPALAEAVHLDFWSCHELTDASVTQLAKLPRLQTLRLVGMPGVTDRTLAAFSGHPALALLVLSGNRVTPDGLKHLRTMKSLEQLSLEHLPVTDDWLAEVAPLTQLTHLGLGLTAPPGRITAAGAAHLKGMKRLQVLNLNAAVIDEGAMAPVTALPALVNLDLQSSQVGDGGMELLAGCPRLTQINVSGSRVTGAGVRHLAKLPVLEFAQLYHVPVGDEDAKALAASKSLKVVWLAFSGIGDEGAIALARMPQLVELDLAACPRVTDRTAAALANHPNLRSFGSDSPELTDAAARHFATVKELRVLALPGTAVTDVSVPAISGLKKLGRLDLTRSKVTPAGFAVLKLALPNCGIQGAPPVDVMAERRKALAWLQGVKAEVHLLLPGDRWLPPDQIKEPLPPEFEIGRLSLHGLQTLTDTDLKAHLHGLDGLRHLDLDNCAKVTDDAAGLLVKLPKLKHLYVASMPGVTDRTFAALAGHPELRAVVLAHTKLSDAAFAGFAAMPKLEHLNINMGPDRTLVTAEGLAELKRSASLRHLTLANVAVTADRLRAIGRLDGLGGLEINQCQISAEGFEAIAGLKNLTLLWLSETNVGDAHLRKLPALPTVKELSFKLCLVGDEGLAGLEKWSALTTLTLQRTEVNGDGLKHLANCPKLNTLNLDRNPVTSKGLIALAESRTISDLWIEGTPMTDAAASALAGMEKLDRIHAVGCNVTDAQCKALSLSHSLTKVGVSGPQITDKAAEHFTHNPRIVQLSFLNSGLTDWSYPVLKGMKQLTWLDLTGSRITPTGVGALRKALPKCNVLPGGPDPVHITAGDRKALQWALDQGAEVGLAHFNDYGRGLAVKKSVDEIGEYEWADWLVPHHINFHRRPVLNAKSVENLRGLTHLVNLGADGSPRSDEWLAALAELPMAGTLVSLSVGGTGLTDAGAKHLAAFPKLHGVYLTGNRLSGDGAAHLRKLPQLRFVLWRETLTDDALKALKGLPLSELHINGNPELTDAGVAHLAGFAELRRLTVGSPKVTDAGLARVLPSLAALTTLWVGRENLGPKTLAAIGECKSLVELELAGWLLDGDKLADLRLAPTVTRLTLLEVPGEVSDATLAELSKQKQLEALAFPAVKLGEERAVKLSKALPDTAVTTAEGVFVNGVKK